VLAQVEEDLDRATATLRHFSQAGHILILGCFEHDLVLGFQLLVFREEVLLIIFIMFCTSLGLAGAFLKMFLGPVYLRATRKEVQLKVKVKVKQGYNSYMVREKVNRRCYLVTRAHTSAICVEDGTGAATAAAPSLCDSINFKNLVRQSTSRISCDRHATIDSINGRRRKTIVHGRVYSSGGL
jgi:hypothetical protein